MQPRFSHPNVTTKTGATVLLSPPFPVLDAGKQQVLKLICIYIYLLCFLNSFISWRELLVCLFMHIFGVLNSIPYVPRLFLILSRTSHNQLHVKLFCIERNALHSTPNTLESECEEARCRRRMRCLYVRANNIARKTGFNRRWLHGFVVRNGS